MFDLFSGEGKKVEYIELSYDLMFVYVIDRNNSLAQHLTGGFIDPGTYQTYVICTMITIQIWFLTTMFINRFGSNEFAEYIGLFINMYLLYYMADSTRVNWQGHFYRYNVAWLLIILNILFQFYLKYRIAKASAPWECPSIRHYLVLLGGEAGLILAGILLYAPTGLFLTPVAVVFGIVFSIVNRKQADTMEVDFPHLTERVMLYIVFTFGEMIIAVSSYFEEDFSWSSVYFSLLCFLIVVGLFMSYGFLYDHLIDREMSISGNAYMLIHIFIIFALSNITTALEFMREPSVAVVPKNIFLVASYVIYYLFLSLILPYTKGYSREMIPHLMPVFLVLAAFVIAMLLFYNNSYFSITASVFMTFVIWYLEYRYWKLRIADSD